MFPGVCTWILAGKEIQSLKRVLYLLSKLAHVYNVSLFN
jgi:hypothetical protein